MESSFPTSPSLPPFTSSPHSHLPLITTFPAIFLRHRKIAPPLSTITASCSSQAPLLSARTVSISYSELKDKNADLSSKIEQGFGANGLGLLFISDVPEYSLLRKNLLHLSTRYSFGWSYGKEKQDGKLDKLKASFFANPILDVPSTEPSNIQRYPSYCRANIWPRTALPELEIAFKALGNLILNVGLLLAHHCDRYGESS
nr:Oxoglutarate/iron-dependent dioxygenase [Ipomoea batatas]